MTASISRANTITTVASNNSEKHFRKLISLINRQNCESWKPLIRDYAPSDDKRNNINRNVCDCPFGVAIINGHRLRDDGLRQIVAAFFDLAKNAESLIAISFLLFMLVKVW